MSARAEARGSQSPIGSAAPLPSRFCSRPHVQVVGWVVDPPFIFAHAIAWWVNDPPYLVVPGFTFSVSRMFVILAKVDKLSKPAPVVKIDSQQQNVSQQKVQKLLLGAVKVFGYVINKSKQPIIGVQVKLYDESNELVKDLKTNDDGYWEVRLPAGRYGVEYLHKNFKPVNKTIEFSKEDKFYEVR